MNHEWIDASVEEIAAPAPYALATGPFGSSIGSRYFTTAGVPLIRGSNLGESVEVRLSHEDLVFVTDEKAEEFKRSIAQRGDLIFTCWGTIGQVGLVDERCPYDRYLISNKQMKLTPDPRKADSLYLYYLFSGPDLSERIKNQAIGSSVPGFNLGQLRALRIQLPPLGEQRAIARILGDIDDKIDLNRRMNQTLEAMAQALFRSWFVDFDPVRLKAEGRHLANVDEETATLFPGAFVDSDVGAIPHKWSVQSLDEVVVLQRGFDLPTSARIPGPYPVMLASGMAEGHAEYKVKGPGIVTGRSGVLGKVFFVQEDFWPLNTTLWVKEFRHSRPHFAYFLLKRIDFSRFNAGSAVPTLNRNHIHSLKVVVPPMELIERFETIAKPMFQLIRKNEFQMETLGSLRDTLLPKLLSGELRVKDAETTVGAAV